MAAILPFAFEVGFEGFFGHVRMHVCVHLHTHACTCVHLGTGTGAGMYVYNVLLTVLAWRPFCLLPFNCFQSHRSDFYLVFPWRGVVIRF